MQILSWVLVSMPLIYIMLLSHSYVFTCHDLCSFSLGINLYGYDFTFVLYVGGWGQALVVLECSVEFSSTRQQSW